MCKFYAVRTHEEYPTQVFHRAMAKTERIKELASDITSTAKRAMVAAKNGLFVFLCVEVRNLLPSRREVVLAVHQERTRRPADTC